MARQNKHSGDDTVKGLKADQVVHGYGGNDNLNGGGGKDALYGDAGSDFLKGDQGQDSLHGGRGDDTLNGGDGNDVLRGDAGNDILQGGAGNDLLLGGEGIDRLTGGTGADQFIFRTISEIGNGGKVGTSDVITDFQTGLDHIDLHRLGIDAASISISHAGAYNIVNIDANHDGTIDAMLLVKGAVTMGDIII